MSRLEVIDESNSPSDPVTSVCLAVVFAAGTALLSYLAYDFENRSAKSAASSSEITKTHSVVKESAPAPYNPN